MLVVATLAVAFRFLIRFRLLQLKRQPYRSGIEDALVVAGLACAISGTTLLLRNIDLLYTPWPAADEHAATADAARTLHYHHCFVACSELLWLAMCAVKFSFLVFFRRLISGLPGRMGAWWWAVLAITVACSLYNMLLPFIGCPYFHDAAKLRK